MFVRFREKAARLQLSIAETHRVGSRVRHEHVGALGSVALPLTVEGRLAFWQRLHERLAKLANRIDAATQAKVLAAVHTRIPIVTLDEQRALQVANAEADERFWLRLHDMQEAQARDNRGLAERAEATAAHLQAAAAAAGAKAAAAKERAERIARGEDVPGGKPLTGEDLQRILDEAGWGARDIEHAGLLAMLSESEITGELVPALLKAKARVERAIICRYIKNRQRGRANA